MPKMADGLTPTTVPPLRLFALLIILILSLAPTIEGVHSESGGLRFRRLPEEDEHNSSDPNDSPAEADFSVGHHDLNNVLSVAEGRKSARHMTYCAKLLLEDNTPLDLAPRRSSLAGADADGDADSDADDASSGVLGFLGLRSGGVAGASSSSPSYGRAGGPATCSKSGRAAGYACRGVDLLSFLPLRDLAKSISYISSEPNGNDIWGWTDEPSGREFALMGLRSGTAFVEITNPKEPTYLGALPGTDGAVDAWRDIKVYRNHAYIVSEYKKHGMQVFKLKQLLDVGSSPQRFKATARYTRFGNAHNIAMNEESGYAYAVGTDTCSGGLHMIDVRTPSKPKSAGCYSGDGYTHDVQCVIYKGPMMLYRGREICFACNEDTVTIVDVTSKSSPVQLSKTWYDEDEYTHQGWLTEDHKRFLFGDEGDETKGAKTTTFVLDVTNLRNPKLIGRQGQLTRAVDHNQYVRGRYTFQANYDAGLRVLDLANVDSGKLKEVAYFDIMPGDDSAEFKGAWSVYPYFPSGTVIVSGTVQGLYVLRPDVLRPKKGPENGDEGGGGQLLYKDSFQFDGEGLSSNRRVTRVRGPQSLKGGGESDYAGRMVVPQKPKRRYVSISVEDNGVSLPPTADQVVLTASIGLASLQKGRIRFQVVVAFDDGSVKNGKAMTLGPKAHIRYSLYERKVSVPDRATEVTRVGMRVWNGKEGQPQQVIYVKDLSVKSPP